MAASPSATLPIRDPPPRLVRLALDDPRWGEFVEGDPAALPYHHPAWAALLAECYRHRAFVLGLERADGRLEAGMPLVETHDLVRGRRWISLPYSDVCPPLAVDGGAAERLVVALDDARLDAGVTSVEVRWPVAGAGATLRTGAVTHTLPLDPDPDVLFRGFKDSVRREVKQADRQRVAIRFGRAEHDLTHTFFRLHVETRRRLGVPVQPRRYFELLWQRVVGRDLGFVLIAELDGRSLAAAVFVAWNGVVTYKYSASDVGAWRLRPNHALLWEAIRWSCENGYRTFDFGRSDVENKGLRRFKRSFGAEELPAPYAFLGTATAAEAGPAGPLARALIRRSPPVVCRSLGRALYRYAA